LAQLTLVLAAYLLGSVPFGLVVARLLGGPDPRAGGSGNIGATNVTRLAGKTAGGLTLVLDAAKGWAPTALALAWWGPGWAAAAVGLAAFLGHLLPIYLRFKGGKGVATALGVMLAVSPWAFLGMLAVLAGVAWLSGYVSLGSLAGCASAPLWLLALREPAPLAAMAGVMALLVLWAHRENIARLRQGQEHSFR
jgi:glycerol-3-phosphate acyltransferase PlsY